MSEPIREIADLDKIVHEPRRFAILNALSGDFESVDYAFLQQVTGLTKGNLAAHLGKLETAGLVEIEKTFMLGRPHTRVRSTGSGRAAVEDHWRRLREVEERVKRWRSSEPVNEQRERAEVVKRWQALEQP